MKDALTPIGTRLIPGSEMVLCNVTLPLPQHPILSVLHANLARHIREHIKQTLGILQNIIMLQEKVSALTAWKLDAQGAS